MSKDLNEWQLAQQRLHNLLNTISYDHFAIAHKAKMTLFEISLCKEISELKSIPIDRVFNQMAAFKESSAYILYNKDFAANY
jgi:hypothetical protein